MLRKTNHRNVVRLLAFDEDKMILERLVCDMQAVLFRKAVAKSAGFTHAWIRRNRLQACASFAALRVLARPSIAQRACSSPAPSIALALYRWLSNSREECARCMATASCIGTSSRRTSYWTVKASEQTNKRAACVLRRCVVSALHAV